MRILMTGVTSYIGKAVAERMHQLGHELIVLSRDPKWTEERLQLPAKYITMTQISRRLPKIDLLLNLAGESLEGEWSHQKKEKIEKTRVQFTRELLQKLKLSENLPNRVIAFSSVDYYGNMHEDLATEHSKKGKDFLAEVYSHQEYVYKKYCEAHTNLVILRLGKVLDLSGGILPFMIPWFKRGLGYVVGRGEQYWSWIALEDLLRLIELFMERRATQKQVVFNAVANEVPTQKEFSENLGRVLNREVRWGIPIWVLDLFMGEEQILLTHSHKVSNLKLLQFGFEFKYKTLDFFLKHEIIKKAPLSNRALELLQKLRLKKISSPNE